MLSKLSLISWAGAVNFTQHSSKQKIDSFHPTNIKVSFCKRLKTHTDYFRKLVETFFHLDYINSLTYMYKSWTFRKRMVKYVTTDLESKFQTNLTHGDKDWISNKIKRHTMKIN